MRNKRIIFYKFIKYRLFLFIFILLNIISITVFSQQDTITKHFSTNNPDNTAFSITNPTDSFSIFTISLNNKLWKDIDEMKRDIYRQARNNKDSLYFYAWKFVCENVFGNVGFSNNNWVATPTVFINSFGSGLCGQQSIILARLWKELGYNSRVWQLTEHAVPEVYYEGNWHMLDPFFKLYYLNDKNNIASVDELTKNQLYFSNNMISFEKGGKTFIKSDKIFELYKTTADNHISNVSYDDIDTKFEIELPPHSTLEFPVLYFSLDSIYRYYANCRLKIPPEWKGNLNNYLVLAKIEGKGNVIMNNKEFSINDASFIKEILSFKTFIKNIYIKEHTDTLNIIYFINPILSELKQNNTLVVNGTNVKRLEIKTINIPDTLSVNKNLMNKYFFYKSAKRRDFMTNKLSANINCIQDNNIKTVNELYNELTKYYICSNEVKTDDINQIINKIKRAISKLPKNYDFNNLFLYTNKISIIMFFDDLINASEEEILRMLLKKKNID